MNWEGYYETVTCSKYIYEEPIDGQFGCEIDSEFLQTNQFFIESIRIEGPDDVFVFAVLREEEFTELMIQDPILKVQGSTVLVEWSVNQDNLFDFEDLTFDVKNQAGDYLAVECELHNYIES